MKQIIILAILATTSFAAKVPVPVEHSTVPVKVTTPVPAPGVVPVSHAVLGEVGVQQKPSIPPHVQHVVQQAHQHIQQVVNHHVSQNKKNQQKVPQVHEGVHVPIQKVDAPVQVHPIPQHHHHVHVDVVQHHADGTKHVAYNHHVAAGEIKPQHIIDKIHKVEQKVHQVMQQAHQHIPQVINDSIKQKQKLKQQQKPVVSGDIGKVPVPVVVPEQHQVHHQQQQHHHLPQVTVKTTTM